MEDGKLGKYEIRGTLGKGAMGTVYEGWDPVILRKVAIKTVKLPDASDADSQEELARFRIEAQAGGRLNHPNICGIFDYGETATFAYIVMEYIDGRTLKAPLDHEERFPVSETVRIMEELLAGLQFSHDRKVVHRDIKPANVMLTNDGQVKIADFGIARIESGNMTQAGAVLGTPAYMSPEQFMGNPVDNRTDIYAAGVVLYQMLTGERPFEGGFSAIMHKALNTQPPRPSDLAVTVPGGFDAVVARAMAKRPDERFATAAEFSRAIRAALSTPAGARPEVVAQPGWDDVTINSQTLGNGTGTSRTGMGTGGFGAGAFAGDDGLMTTLNTAMREGGPMPPPGRPGGAAVVAQPKPAPNRMPVFIGVGLLAVALAGAGGWYATRPQPAPAPVHIADATPPETRKPDEVKPADPGPVVLPVPVATLAAALATVPCTMVGGDVTQPDGAVLLTGLVHTGGPEAAVRKVLSDIAPKASLSWHITTFDGPYCRALDLLRPLAPRFGDSGSGFVLALAGDRTRLADGQLITLHLTTPSFPATLQVDYLQHDGSVFHMHPTPTDPARVYPAGSRQSLGDPTAGGARWEVSEPYGTEIITAIGSSVPLFARPRPESETNDGYLKDLQTALEAAKARGASFSVGAVILDTEPKKSP